MNMNNICGFPVFYKQIPSELATVRIICNSGSNNDDSSAHGVAHFLEHMMFKGTKNKTGKQISMLLAEYGDANAYTNYGRTVYHLNCLNQDFDKTFDLLLEMVFESNFPEEEFERERQVILEEYQSGEDNPQSYFCDHAIEKVFGKPCHNIVGTRESINNMTVEHLQDYMKRYYTRNNMMFAIAGNITWDEIFTHLSKSLDKYQDYHVNNFDRFYFMFSPKQEVNLTHQAEQSIFTMFYRSLPLTKLVEKRFVNEVFENGLGGGFHSLLFEAIREKLGLCYSIGAYSFDCTYTDALMIHTMLSKENIDLAREEIEKVMEEVKCNGFTDELLRVSKKNALHQVAKGVVTVDGYAHVFFDKQQSYGYTMFDFDTVRQGIESITNTDIIEYAQWVLESGYQFACMNK